jgi:hypothetical protein
MYKNFFLRSKETYNPQDIIHRLRNGDNFSGRNGAFSGIMTAMSVSTDTNSLKVRCQKDGSTWIEEWDDLDVTVNAFVIGEYYFLDY